MTQTTEAMIRSLEAYGDYRVLQRLDAPHASEEGLLPESPFRIAILDVETEGLDPEQHGIIEIALMLVDVNRDDGCAILAHSEPQAWLQAPGRRLEMKIEAITGLTNAMLAGQAIDDDAVRESLGSADLIVAHNARFDRAFVERRWPELAGKAWACSCHEIDWLQLRFDGRSLGYLLLQQGFFNTAHRAGDDVWSLFHLLTWVPPGSSGYAARSHLDRLVEASETESYRIEATHAPFAAKDMLKARGYRWNPTKRFWWTEVALEDFLDEKLWFDEQGLPPFTMSTLDATQRHI